MRLLDLFCGRWGWSRAFAARGWKCTGIDLVPPPEVPNGCEFVQGDILLLDTLDEFGPHFIVASSPCEQFSVHGMKHFHPNPVYPKLGLELFNHTRALCEESGVPYVMENVRAAEQFVGNATRHCGPFYLWGSGVPLLMPQGIHKNQHFRALPGNVMEKILKRKLNLKTERNRYQDGQLLKARRAGPGEWSNSKDRIEKTALAATIPPELSACVADYAERILECSRPK